MACNRPRCGPTNQGSATLTNLELGPSAAAVAAVRPRRPPRRRRPAAWPCTGAGAAARRLHRCQTWLPSPQLRRGAPTRRQALREAAAVPSSSQQLQECRTLHSVAHHLHRRMATEGPVAASKPAGSAMRTASISCMETAAPLPHGGRTPPASSPRASLACASAGKISPPASGRTPQATANVAKADR